MKYRKLGKSDLNASVVGLGTWVTGGGIVWGKNPDDNESIRAIQASIDAGVNLIDTAPAYGFGRSEEVIGKAIQGRRDQVIIATKCGLWTKDKRGSFFCEFDGRDMYRCLRPDTIREEVEMSLRRLGVDVIDLYQVHWPAIEPEKTPIAETMGCLMDLKAQGKIRAIGVSNVCLDEMKEYEAHGVVDTNQPRYSMFCRGIEKDILPYCIDHRISTLSYMSLEQGLLTGKVTMDRQFDKNEWRSNEQWNPWFKPANRKRVLDLLASWKDLTVKYDCTLAQLAIAWTFHQPGVTHVLCGARTQTQAMDNAKAGSLALEPADVDRIRNEVIALGEPV
ncbi:MAG: aldo/keto reductase [Candidatus Omnitrophota bacterium]|nr:MAG: aldo/keto reductase [Candidatus Omnitrophota bacterium]